MMDHGRLDTTSATLLADEPVALPRRSRRSLAREIRAGVSFIGCLVLIFCGVLWFRVRVDQARAAKLKKEREAVVAKAPAKAPAKTPAASELTTKLAAAPASSEPHRKSPWKTNTSPPSANSVADNPFTKSPRQPSLAGELPPVVTPPANVAPADQFAADPLGAEPAAKSSITSEPTVVAPAEAPFEPFPADSVPPADSQLATLPNPPADDSPGAAAPGKTPLFVPPAIASSAPAKIYSTPPPLESLAAVPARSNVEVPASDSGTPPLPTGPLRLEPPADDGRSWRAEPPASASDLATAPTNSSAPANIAAPNNTAPTNTAPANFPDPLEPLGDVASRPSRRRLPPPPIDDQPLPQVAAPPPLAGAQPPAGTPFVDSQRNDAPLPASAPAFAAPSPPLSAPSQSFAPSPQPSAATQPLATSQPRAAANPQPEPTGVAPGAFRPEDHSYTVGANENYWVISKRLYGTGGYFKALYEHNRQRYPSPSRLQAGDVISAPPAHVLEQTYPQLCPQSSAQQATHAAPAGNSASGVGAVPSLNWQPNSNP
ncbi:MAG: hypothetical protein K1X71_01410 [Pirellulales bacterium]|nr:hypothetical protein [Pirellulales bacterium]